MTPPAAAPAAAPTTRRPATRPGARPGTRRRAAPPRRVSVPAGGRTAGAVRASAAAIPAPGPGRGLSIPLPSLPALPRLRRRGGGGSRPLADRLVRGRYWIPLIGFLLLGIVAVQVTMLELNAGISGAVEHSSTLERSNGELRAEVSRLTSGKRIQSEAKRLGMVMPPAGKVRYRTVRPAKDPQRALKVMRAPEPQTAAATATAPAAAVQAPVATDPTATDPTATDPTATDPTATDPVATAPVAAEPVTPSTGGAASGAPVGGGTAPSTATATPAASATTAGGAAAAPATTP